MKTFLEPDMLAYLDGRLGPDETREFEDALRLDPRLRKDLLVLANFEAELPVALHELAAETSVAPSSAKRPAARLVLRVLLPLAAAAGLVIAVRVVLPHARPAQVPAAIAIQQPVEGRIVEVSGEVRMTEAGAPGSILVRASGVVVHAGATITLETNASASFAYADGSVLRLYKDTVVVLKRTEAGPSVELQRGALDADIRPQPAGSALVMRTSFLHADIVGTEFRLMADSKSAWLGVREGAVRVTREADGQTVDLAGGNYAAVAPDWPFMRMNARTCPLWKSICQQAANSPYP